MADSVALLLLIVIVEALFAPIAKIIVVWRSKEK